MSDHNDILSELKQIREYTRISSKNTLNLEEAAIYCSFSRDYMYRMASNIDHSKRGGYIYFKKEDLDNWLSSERIPTETQKITSRRSKAAMYVVTHKQ